jgi:hypothetical protein
VWAFAKQLAFGRGRRPHKIWLGVAAGRTFLIDPAGKTQRIVGLDEYEIGGLFARHIKDVNTVIDVGASDGYYTILALCLNPAATAIGCDPHPPYEQHARENYRLNFPNGGPKLEWISGLVGPGPGQRSLDEIASGRRGPFLLKIDVDGAEIEVLQSGEHLLARRDCRVLLEVHSPELEAEAIQLLTARGYACQIVDNAWWRVVVPERRPGELNRWVFASPIQAVAV